MTKYILNILWLMMALPGFADASPRPNILLILVDDVGYADINAFAAPLRGTAVEEHFRETPRIDQLASDGIRLTQFYACSVCTPSRASLLTGKMHNRMGMWDAFARVRTTFQKTGKPVPEGAYILDHEPWDEYRYSRTNRGVSVPLAATALHDVKTIPQGLKGYHSAFIGKWHLGNHNKAGHRPEDLGFNETLAYYDAGGSSYYRPFKAQGKPWDKPGPELSPVQDYLSDDVAQRVNVFLEERATRHPEEPFFLYVAHPACHEPVQSREDDRSYFKEKAKKPGWLDSVSPEYAGLIKGMDRSIGAMLDSLDQHGLADNTAVIFISDNGGHPRFTNSLPLQGGKSMQYEGGIRVPVIVRWPGHIQAGISSDVPCDIADIYPTIMEIAGIDDDAFKADPATDGHTLSPLFVDWNNSEGGYERDAFYQFYGKMGYTGFHNFASWATLRKGDYKLHYDYQGKVELYNIAMDISESNDLTATNPGLALQMLIQLTDWLQGNCPDVYLPQPNPDFDPDGPLPFGPYIPLDSLKESLNSAQKYSLHQTKTPDSH